MYTYRYTHIHTHTDLSRHRYTRPCRQWYNNFGTFKNKKLKANKRQRARTNQITFRYNFLPSNKNNTEMNREIIQSRNLNNETQGRQGERKPVFKFEHHSPGNL